MSLTLALTEEFRACDEITADDTRCTFEGDVEIVVDTRADSATWKCPLCGLIHDEDAPAGGDD